MNEKHPSTSAGDCNSIEDLIPAYAFGLTDPEETTLVEANLGGCNDASIELVEYRQLQDEMRASVRQIDPPLMLMTRLAEATATPSVPVAVVPKARRRLPLPWLAAAAALVALVLTNVFWLAQVNTLNQQTTDYLANDNDQFADAGSFVLTNTSDLRWVRLQPTEQDGKAAAFLCWNAESQTALLYAWGLPVTPGQSYQLWLTRDNTLVNAGTLRLDDKGRTVMLIHSDQPIDQYTWARITAESGSGSAQPSGNTVVNGEL
jgi:hypothetical protein